MSIYLDPAIWARTGLCHTPWRLSRGRPTRDACDIAVAVGLYNETRLLPKTVFLFERSHKIGREGAHEIHLAAPSLGGPNAMPATSR